MNHLMTYRDRVRALVCVLAAGLAGCGLQASIAAAWGEPRATWGTGKWGSRA